SGAGAENIGVAGAVAIDISGGETRAEISAGANVVSKGAGGDVLVQASSTADDAAIADARTSGGKGVGACLAVAVATHDVDSELDGTVGSSHDVNIVGIGNFKTTTNAFAGAQGGRATAPAIALSIANNDTSALLKAGAMLTVASDLLVRASHRTTSRSSGGGGAAGSDSAVGAALAVTIGLDDAVATVGG